MSYSTQTTTQTQLRFPAIAGFTVRADFDGGAMSSDFGALLLRGVDHQTGLIERLAAAIEDKRHPSYIDHSLTDLLRQRNFPERLRLCRWQRRQQPASCPRLQAGTRACPS